MADPTINTAFADIERVNEFTRLCRNQPAQVLAWIRELERITNEPMTGSVIRPSFKVVYGKFLGALMTHIGGLDDDAAARLLRDSNALRDLLAPGGGTLGALAVRQRQSRAGKKPRPSTLMKKITEIVAKNLEITPDGLWDRLLQLVCPDTTIFESDDDTICWRDAKGKEHVTPKRAIKDLLYRARKALKALDRP